MTPRSRLAPRWLLALSALIVVGACADTIPATQVLVVVDAQPGVRMRGEFLAILVRGYDGRAALDPDGGVGASVERFNNASSPFDKSAETGGGWPHVVALAPIDGDVTRVYELEARAVVPAGVNPVNGERLFTNVAVARTRSGYAPGRTVVLRVTLYDNCIGVTCEPESTCAASGQCVPTDFVDPNTLVEVDTDGGPEDASVAIDLGVVDAGIDGQTDAGCTADSCDDGNPCNGMETCLEGVCVPGAELSCDDRVECTDDQCTAAGCEHTPNESICTLGTGATCNLTSGCQYEVCNATNCTPGPCQTAVCNGNVCERTSLCASDEMCCASSCVAMGCSDGNPCTDDACGASGCTNVANSNACSDADLCTMGDQCMGGICSPGAPLSCDDGISCTTDSCVGGACVFRAIPACGVDGGPGDGGVDLGIDAGRDAGVDLGIDAGMDLGIDAGVDLGIDAGVDLGIDAGGFSTDAGSLGLDAGCGSADGSMVVCEPV